MLEETVQIVAKGYRKKMSMIGSREIAEKTPTRLESVEDKETEPSGLGQPPPRKAMSIICPRVKPTRSLRVCEWKWSWEYSCG